MKKSRSKGFCALSFVWIVFILLCGCGYGGREDIILNDAGERQAEEGSSGKEDYALAAGSDSVSEGENVLIRVYVCGAVINPGVVSVPAGSRAEEALAAAGGFREDAGREAVNLADWITDGQMLYFPTQEEAEERQSQESAVPGLVNINTADSAQLCTLPGIGESRAADIIAYREKNGDFRSCEDIMQVPGIKTNAYEKIKDKITVK